MVDQKNNAGNIGDVIKHALLAEICREFGKAQSEEWVYCETHAGYYEYDLAHLKNGSEWKGERAWSVRVLEQNPASVTSLGKYGRELDASLKRGVYPGSIRIVDEATKDIPTLKAILGWDVGDEQKRSFPDSSGRIRVSLGDGYAGAKAAQAASKLVFCDPFWTDDGEDKRVKELLSSETPTVVWYPLSAGTNSFREWIGQQNLCFIEMHYRNYRGGDGWGRDMQGAGLVLRGVPEVAITRAIEVGRALKAIFEGQRHPAKPRKVKGGGVRLPPDRDLGLRLTLSH